MTTPESYLHTYKVGGLTVISGPQNLRPRWEDVPLDTLFIPNDGPLTAVLAIQRRGERGWQGPPAAPVPP